MGSTEPVATSRVAMVHVEDPRGRWSVSASEVIRIINATEWAATAPIDPSGAAAPRGLAAPIDPLAALGALPQSRTRRVLVMRGARNREIALVAAGALAVAEVAPGDVLPLPSVLATSSPTVSAIVVAPDASLSLLIEPSAVTSGPVVGEELCPSHS